LRQQKLNLALYNFVTINNIEEIRKQVKKYIDEADNTTVKMIHAMLETQQQSDWWDDLPENVQEEIDSAIEDLDQGKGVPHKKMKEMYPQWFKK